MEGLIDRRIDGQIDGWMDGLKDRRRDINLGKCTTENAEMYLSKYKQVIILVLFRSFSRNSLHLK